MVLIKKLDLFILKKFLLVFFGAFFVTLFVFMMQFTWQQLDKLVGKGLTADVLAEFFWYMAITIVPMSLPMSVLLASLISFGNMGEKLELLSMKAAGISLVRIMRPVGVLAVGFMVLLFHFQNKTSPDAQLKLRTLIFSLKQTSPALEIPEGVFYNGVPSFNLYVEKKNVATGMLYNLMVYKTDEGFDKAQIVVADSGRMEMTDDKMHLVLDIWGGEQFENLNGGQAGQMGVKNNPSDRETFRYKRFIIDFDSNFDRMDEEQLRGMPSAKNLVQLDESIDSVNAELDSIGRAYYKELIPRAKPLAQLKKNKMKLAPSASVQESGSGDAAAPSVEASAASARVPIANAKPTEAENANDKLASALRMARNDVSRAKAELEWRSSLTEDEERYVRRHRMEWHQKFTLSLACLFFFLIGAPLGAIVRKGGLGMPAVISVVIFIIYYLMNTLGSKMAKDGTWDVVFGMWMSTAVLAPTGIWLTYKSNRDSRCLHSRRQAFLRHTLCAPRHAQGSHHRRPRLHAPRHRHRRAARRLAGLCQATLPATSAELPAPVLPQRARRRSGNHGARGGRRGGTLQHRRPAYPEPAQAHPRHVHTFARGALRPPVAEQGVRRAAAHRPCVLDAFVALPPTPAARPAPDKPHF